MKPEEIEQESMKTIRSEMGEWRGREEELPVVMRVIHATADFDFRDNMRFSDKAVELARMALKSGCTLVTDTKMAAAGINRSACGRFGVNVVCRMSDPDIREAAQARGVTRAVVSVCRIAGSPAAGSGRESRPSWPPAHPSRAAGRA